MAIACLAAQSESAGERLARQGYALLDGTATSLKAALASFDALSADAEGSVPLAPDHALVRGLLAQPAVRELVAEAVGASAVAIGARAIDQVTHLPVTWHQAHSGFDDPERALILRWHLDLIGPADGGLRVLPGSNTRGRLATEEIAKLATEIPAAELAVSAGTVLALRPRLVQGCRRRTTRGHRRILHVEIAAGHPPPPLGWTAG